MGLALDVVLEALEWLMDIRDAPGLPSTPFLAYDTVLGNKDPTWEEVGREAAKDGADLLVPGLGPLGEKAAESFNESMEKTRERRDLLEDILKSKERNPGQDGD